MNICVAGWYYEPRFMKVMFETEFPVFLVKHRPCQPNGHSRIVETLIPNTGLEFGCYDWFLKHMWTGGDTLFTHDDNLVTHEALRGISNLNLDQAFLFTNREEVERNGAAHGRAMFLSNRLLSRLKSEGGFWFDEGNTGQVPETTSSADFHNNGIQMFMAYLESLPEDWEVGVPVVVEGLTNGHRGKLNG